MLSRKSIVLSGVNNDEKKAVLSLEFEDENLSGKVRLYNFSNEPMGILSLGLTGDEGVIKAGLTREGSMLFTFATPLKKMPENFSCAIVNFVGGQPSPLLFGCSQGHGDLEKTLGEVVGALQNTKSAQEVEKLLDDYGVDFDDELKAQVDEDIEKSMLENQLDEKCDCESREKCNECIYKKYFFEHSGVEGLGLGKEEQPSNKPIESPKEDTQEKPEFFDEIKPQVELLFSENKPEEYLEQAIPSSKWVKVDFDDGGDYYVFGLIYEEEVLKYVCYGIPGVYSQNPPKQLSGYPIWFPLDKEKSDGFGYWLSYQDASTGESIKAIIE